MTKKMIDDLFSPKRGHQFDIIVLHCVNMSIPEIKRLR